MKVSIFFEGVPGPWFRGFRMLRGFRRSELRAAVESAPAVLVWGPTRRLLSSSFLGLPYRILNINHQKELLRGLWVDLKGTLI